MDPSIGNISDQVRLQGSNFPKKPSPTKPKKTDLPKDQFRLSGGGKETKETALVSGDQPAPMLVDEASKAEATDNHSPQVLLAQEPEQASKPKEQKTLEELTRSFAESKLKNRRSPLPRRPLTAGRKASLLRRVANGFLKFLGGSDLKPFQKNLNKINALEKSVSKLTTPAQFQAKTADFKARIAKGESLSEIRNEAYAVARQACVVALGMRPYDCQILGALAMDDSHIAEMKTGEGKTLTAVLPLYLNALMGKGAHLVTVNDTLAARDAKEMGPAFELMGLSVGTVLEDMKVDQKRAGYAADITYTTDRSLGFDYLRDRTAKHPSARLQREPFFALVDEVDEVLIDEARSPLIVSGPGESNQAEFQEFGEIVKQLKAGSDYFIDRKKHAVWPSESGFARIENLISKRQLVKELKESPLKQRELEIKSELKKRDEIAKLITAEQEAFQAYRDSQKGKPGQIARWRGAEWDESKVEEAKANHEAAIKARTDAMSQVPEYNLFSTENGHRSRFLYASLKAQSLFSAGDDYSVSTGSVEIIDQNKGRTSAGRRYNDGIHQAIEAKEGVPIGDEQQTITSITYPNLFKIYPRLAGMSGTAKSSEREFHKLYDLDVVQVPTNKPVIRVDEPDLIFATFKDKYEAIATDASRDFFEGKPVLIGTLSVEHNEYLAELLLEKGVPRESLQVLNADTVRGDKASENEIIQQAGRSGVITVATNMAGRGANIKPDLVNFKKLVDQTLEAHAEGKPVVVTLEKKKEADWLQSWLAQLPTEIVAGDNKSALTEGKIRIRYTEGDSQTAPLPNGAFELKGEDFPTGGLHLYGSERSLLRIDDQLIGRSGRQGAPGWSRFYLSLEDDLLRVNSPKNAKKLQKIFAETGQGMKSDEAAQLVRKIQYELEADHFASREKLNKEDEVLNEQRDTFFALRDELLEGGESMFDRMEDLVGNALVDSVFGPLEEKGPHSYTEIRDAVDRCKEELSVPLELAFLDHEHEELLGKKMSSEDLELELRDWAQRKVSGIQRKLDASVLDTNETVRPMLLGATDSAWSGHLDAMELLSLGSQLQAHAQKDPEIEFKLGAFDLFEETIDYLEKDLTKTQFNTLLALSAMMSPAKSSGGLASLTKPPTKPNPPQSN